jgi:hypothetical protein
MATHVLKQNLNRGRGGEPDSIDGSSTVERELSKSVSYFSGIETYEITCSSGSLLVKQMSLSPMTSSYDADP